MKVMAIYWVSTMVVPLILIRQNYLKSGLSAGFAQLLYNQMKKAGSIIVTATSENLKNGVLEIKTNQAEIKPAVKSDLIVNDYMFFRRPEGWDFK